MENLTPEVVAAFLATRRAEGYTLWLSEKGIAPLLTYLRSTGAAPTPATPVAVTVADRLLDEFRSYLLHERGLAWGTVAADVHIARLFLATRPEDDLELELLSAEDIVGFVKAQCEQRSAAYITAGLRAFLRFCHLSGRTPRSLVHAVPRVASWRLAKLPKVVTPKTVDAPARKLRPADDDRPPGLRRAHGALPPRACARAKWPGLRLEDIDWRAGELVVRGKGAKLERLPLPADVGEAIAAWVRRGRPRCAAREVFTRVRSCRTGDSPPAE